MQASGAEQRVVLMYCEILTKAKRSMNLLTDLHLFKNGREGVREKDGNKRAQRGKSHNAV